MRLSFLVLAALPSLVLAQDPPKPREFTADAGFVNTSGNTQVTTINLGEKLILRRGRVEHKQQFGAVYGELDGKQNSNLIFANWRSDVAFSKAFGFFGFVGYDRNAFAGISRRFEEAAGLSAKLLTRDSDIWTLELGLAMNQQRATDGTTLNFASIRSGTTFKHHFSKAAFFTQALEFLPSLKISEDYRINSESGIVAPLSSHMSMKAAYVIRYDNLPETGRLASDRIFTTGLQFNW